MERNRYKTVAIGFVALLTAAHTMAQGPVTTPAPPAPKAATGPKAASKAPKFEFKWNDASVKTVVEKLNGKVLAQVNASLNQLDSKLGTITFIGHDKGNDDYQSSYDGALKTKVISKSYSVDRNDKLAVDNQFGKVVVTTWSKNEIKVDVEIKAYEGSESAAEELLETVSINDSKQPNLISFKTSISRGSSSHWYLSRRNGKEDRRGVEVNYIVFMPNRNPLDIYNKFGVITMSDYDGPVNINSVNGSFKAGKLSNPANRVIVSQGSADIETLNSGNIKVSMGSLKIENANKVTANVSMSSTKIGTLTNGGIYNINMGSCKVAALSKNIKDVVITADKSTVYLGIDPGVNFNFDVTVNLGSFSFDKSKVSLSSQPDNSRGYTSSQNYRGDYGKGSDSKITIKSSYGTVKFE